jgi:hypothetical protein
LTSWEEGDTGLGECGGWGWGGYQKTFPKKPANCQALFPSGRGGAEEEQPLLAGLSVCHSCASRGALVQLIWHQTLNFSCWLSGATSSSSQWGLCSPRASVYPSESCDFPSPTLLRFCLQAVPKPRRYFILIFKLALKIHSHNIIQRNNKEMTSKFFACPNSCQFPLSSSCPLVFPKRKNVAA